MFKFLERKKYRISASANLSMLEKLFKDFELGDDSPVDYNYWIVNLRELKSALEYLPECQKEYDMYNEVFELFKKKYDLH